MPGRYDWVHCCRIGRPRLYRPGWPIRESGKPRNCASAFWVDRGLDRVGWIGFGLVWWPEVWVGSGRPGSKPGIPNRPELKPKVVSLCFLHSHKISLISCNVNKPLVNQDFRHLQVSLILRNFQPQVFNYPFSLYSRILILWNS